MAKTTMLAAICCFWSLAAAHSWPEWINTIDDTGALTGPNGYPRHWAKRTDPGWNDYWFTNRIIQVNQSVMTCPPHQMTQNQAPGLPTLQVSPGGLVAIRYLENGHVTQPQIPPGKPEHSGTVYIYGSQDAVAPKLLDMLEWTADGKGGDGKGKLIVAQPFDDGECYQVNPKSNIYNQRAGKYDNNKSELPCQVDFAVPTEAKVGELYSIFWYWNWTTVAENDNMQDQELYTSCMDFQITDAAANATSKSQDQKPSFNATLPIASQAIPAYFNSLIGQQTADPTVAAPAPSAASTPDPVTSLVGAIQSAVDIPLEEGTQGGAVIVPSSVAANMATPSPTPAATPVATTMVTTMTPVATDDSKPTVLPLTASLPDSSAATPLTSSVVSTQVQAAQATSSPQPRPINPATSNCNSKRGLGRRSRLFGAVIDEMARREAKHDKTT